MGTFYADIRFARGLEENLPTLDEGKPAFTKDTKSVFVGSADGNVELAKKELVDTLNITLAESTQIKGTTQFITFNSDGTVQMVQHKDALSNVLREDVFTYEPNLITEVRTLSSGGSLTFKYHLDTLETEVI